MDTTFDAYNAIFFVKWNFGLRVGQIRSVISKSFRTSFTFIQFKCTRFIKESLTKIAIMRQIYFCFLPRANESLAC